MKTPERGPDRPKKRPYRTPKLTTHGDLRLLTRTKNGGRADGIGNPKTRVEIIGLG
jgi:hypothetical protein